MRRPFEIIEHPADVGFRAYGATLEELFANAALAMLSLGCALKDIEEREQREVAASGRDAEALLYAWLADILAAGDAEQIVFGRVEVTSFRVRKVDGEAPSEVRGIAYGEKFDPNRHTAGTYIKAVTYHQLRVEQTLDGWRGQVFLDV